MDVLIAQTQFVSVEKILRHKTRKIWRHAKMRKALIWGSVSLIAEMTKIAKIHVLTILK